MINRENLPHATVATVIERDGKFLLVKEFRDNKVVYNQPAGHVESGENLLDAALRETREETGWDVQLTHCLGICVYHAANGISYIRTTFCGITLNYYPDAPLDEGIEEAVWLTFDQIKALGKDLRSPIVLKVIEDYLAGTRYPLDMISEHR